MKRLYYAHDPMCSWCYAFAPVLARLVEQLPPGVALVRLLGGLAPDNDQPMASEMRERLAATWRRIEEQVPGTRFNHDFWSLNTPRRATYDACRAVIAARLQGDRFDQGMTRAIQHAYYREARNPSDEAVLLALAVELGLEPGRFAEDLRSSETEAQLQAEIVRCRELHADSFPSLILECGSQRWPIAIDYSDHEPMLETITLLLE